MKKLILSIILCVTIGVKAQPPIMIVHGTIATKFYYYDGSVTYNLFADEIWVADESIITDITDGIYTPVNDFPDDASMYGCQYAGYLFGHNKVRCGPFHQYGERMTCDNVNSTACSIGGKLSDGSDFLCWSNNGWFPF